MVGGVREGGGGGVYVGGGDYFASSPISSLDLLLCQRLT